MGSPSPATPLVAIDALSLDTEATSLDARVARIVQVGAVGISAGRIDRSVLLDQLIDPGVPIPAASTDVHGIGDGDVAGQPRFSAIAKPLSALLDNRLLVGHSIAYDLALLASEHRLAGLPWSSPRALDVRALARLAAPALADHSLDRLCEWLSVVNARRHSALGDAVATAEVFIKLVPLLRAKGIRTLAEAEQACLRQAESDARMSGGLMSIEAAADQSLPALARLDVFAFRHRVRDVMTAPAAIVDGAMTVGEAMGELLKRGYSSVFVDVAPDVVGIVTERDLLRTVHAHGGPGFALALREIAKVPLQTVEESDHVYRAIGRMERLGFRHLGVRDARGRIVGALTPRNLLRNRASSAIAIGDATASAQDAGQLAVAWAGTPAMASALLTEGVEARTVASVISAEICAITRRAAALTEAEMAAAGLGPPPCPYAVLVLGSAGRGESLLAADQDNAIIFESGEPGSENDKWFERLGIGMTQKLDQAGIVFCKGGVMASTPEWRHSRDGWNAMVSSWVRRQKPQDLLNVDIFFDAVAVHGDRELGERLLAQASELAARTPDFLMMLTELTRRWQPPLKMLGGFALVDGRVDLKLGGLLPIFTGARLLSLRHRIAERSTVARLRGLAPLGIATSETIEGVLDAHELIMRAILMQQLDDVRKGTPLSPKIDPARLTKSETRELKAAVQAVKTIVELVSEGRL